MSSFKIRPSDFVDDVEKFSGEYLNRKAELLRIYEESINAGKENVFSELSFTAKYLRNLMNNLSDRSSYKKKSLKKIKNDFSAHFKKFIEQLKDITANSDQQFKKHFEENYYNSSGEGLINLNELLSDLEWTSKYLTEQNK